MTSAPSRNAVSREASSPSTAIVMSASASTPMVSSKSETAAPDLTR